MADRMAKANTSILVVDDSSDTRVFFCIKTFDALGPDQEPVSPGDCTKSRSCFRS